MDIWHNELWKRLFGSAWKTLAETDRRLGAFAVVHDTKEVLADENACKLLGFNDMPDYDTFIEVIGRIGAHAKFSSPLQMYPLETDENVTAGFLRIEEELSSVQAAELFPVCTQTQLIRQMSADGGGSLLALVQLEGAENPAHAVCCTVSALNAVSGRLPERAVIASHSERQFWIYVPQFNDDPLRLLEGLKDAVENCDITDEFGVVISVGHSMTLTAGYIVGSEFPAQKLHLASFALFEAQTAGCGSICRFSPEQYELQKNEFHNISIFSKLIEQNLFIYHFQPIVSARSGDIVAYEALMRTDESIGLNPMQILDMAQKFGRLYDIEKATLYNTLSYLSNHQEDFGKRRLFVNAITSHLLNDEDFDKLRADFGELLEKIVIELTEQTETSDEVLEILHRRMKRDNIQLAIDDYGTGYSNTSNLMRYNPDIVKIDRTLIADIDTNTKMQKILANIIDFLHASGYIALAEGVETSEELKTMIAFGADLIQGYYISRPKPVLLHEISENVRSEIVRINLESGGVVQKIYHPSEKEIVDISRLAIEKYTGIFINVSEVTLLGTQGQIVPLTVTVKEETKCDITLKNAGMMSNSDSPVIRMGNSCDVHIKCIGKNNISMKGIFVPRRSSLRISGAGDLDICSESLNCYAIGCDCDHSFGNITIDMTGRLAVNVNGERCIGIGGGKNSEGNRIRIMGGDISVACSGGTCVGIGSFSGNALVEIADCGCNVSSSSNNAVAIGAVRGNADIDIRNFSIECSLAGNTQTAVGVITEGEGKIKMYSGRANITMRGRNLTCIGSRGGEVECAVDKSRITLYCEGNSVSGIGDMQGGGDVSIIDSDLSITFLTGQGRGLGSPEGKLTVLRGSKIIKINE